MELAGSGPRASIPSALSRSTAGRTTVRSSSPSAPCSPACGLRPATARRGCAIPKRSRRSWATIRPVVVTSSGVSAATTSRNGKWIVTGTTASSGDQSIMTGCAATPVDCSESLARYSVCPGSANPDRYRMFLAIGLVTMALAAPAITSATARRMAASAAGALDRSGRPGSALMVTPTSTTGKAVLKVAHAADGATTATATSGAIRSARRATNFGSASR